MDMHITPRRVTGYTQRLEPASAVTPCLNLLPVAARTRRAPEHFRQARQPQACVLYECAQQQVSTTAALKLEAQAQHTFERLIIGRSVFRKGWRLWVMSELFKLKDELLSTRVRAKLITFLKDTHYS